MTLLQIQCLLQYLGYYTITVDGIWGPRTEQATMIASPNAATLATEAAVNTFVRSYSVAKENVVADGVLNATVAAASDDMVPSEKAVVAAISWKTTV